MSATCPTCSWSTPTAISAHGSVRYLRCVCGRWLIVENDQLVAAVGASAFASPRRPPR
ncbi:hypothetical protein NDR87_32000 [Nocardia sp. CDC159]|uniref:Uncharacterized protein n=1 Tax=Nocardia pulmonis TaxID=2951408 RepID=A0A9X2ED10_9NOCA|nr:MULTISPECIES: hypothetical protein [Nocardia]MCM6778115.1 hypothetical protein [Nocardia pulmonis]MCM6791004.1 hypothetical protein [Nocardia sp. CDC159]